MVFSFMLTPYTSFWQPEQPTYNPIEACFELTHPQIDGGKTPYYESPRFYVHPRMKVSVLYCRSSLTAMLVRGWQARHTLLSKLLYR